MTVLPINTRNTGASSQRKVYQNYADGIPEASFTKALSKAVESLLRDEILEMQMKLENGETEPSVQIGGRFFTEKEWENLMHKVDKALEAADKKQEPERERENASKIDLKDKEN